MIADQLQIPSELIIDYKYIITSMWNSRKKTSLGESFANAYIPIRDSRIGLGLEYMHDSWQDSLRDLFFYTEIEKLL